MADAFAGAERQIDQQRQAALNALAQFGRGGLEQAAATQRLSQQAASRSQQGVASDVADFGIGGAGAAELAAFSAPSEAAFSRDAAGNAFLLKGENRAARAVNANFFGQARQGVSALRSNAQAIQEQFRAAAEERRRQQEAQLALFQEQRQRALAQMQAEREQAALQSQAQQQEMAQAQSLASLQQQALQAELERRGLLSTPAPAPSFTETSLLNTPTPAPTPTRTLASPIRFF